ncbi:MAG: helix-turn-helix transcriptional regulator, partial [Thiolinea sp.]
FVDWVLTPSETEVAMLLLKGLSFEEIAGVRDTKEKTVRQQATAIYRKSGLNGRHEFAAWFFEDFLQ